MAYSFSFFVIQCLVKHVRWSFLRKWLTVESRSRFLQKALCLVFDCVLNTSLSYLRTYSSFFEICRKQNFNIYFSNRALSLSTKGCELSKKDMELKAKKKKVYSRSKQGRSSVKKKVFQACNSIKKRLQHWCFTLNFEKFLRTPVLKNFCNDCF